MWLTMNSHTGLVRHTMSMAKVSWLMRCRMFKTALLLNTPAIRVAATLLKRFKIILFFSIGSSVGCPRSPPVERPKAGQGEHDRPHVLAEPSEVADTESVPSSSGQLPFPSPEVVAFCMGLGSSDEVRRIANVTIDEISFSHRVFSCSYETPVPPDLACQIARRIGSDDRFGSRTFVYLAYNEVAREQYDTNTSLGRRVAYVHARGDLFVGDPRRGSRRYCIEQHGDDVTLRLYIRYG